MTANSENTRTLRAVLGLLMIIAAFTMAGGIVGAQSATGPGGVLTGRIDGPIDPSAARILKGWIEDAESSGASLFVLELDTPGGDFDSTRDIAGALLDSSVPVAVFVTPSGARAASAGTFVVAAGHLAAMSPGTNIGAASPVNESGEDLPETLKAKATQDAAAFLREIATRRDRNSEALERTVFEAASYNVQESLDLDIIDLSATDLDDLVAKIDGRTVTVRGIDRTISTADVAVERVEADPVQRFLKWLANPHLVFVMLAAGGILILIETISPGGWVAGISGAGLLVLAFLGMGSLPVNWVGLVLIGVGLVLFFWELQAPGWGGFGAAGGVSFVVGGFLLFGDSSIPGLPAPDVRVGIGVLGGTALFMAASLAGLWHFARKARALPNLPRDSQVVGQTGVVRMALEPKGTVQVASELWTAESDSGEPIESGASVVVADVDGVTLKVFREETLNPPGRRI